jgi:mannose-6-phosphate isomerase
LSAKPTVQNSPSQKPSDDRFLPTPILKTEKPWGYELLWAKTEKYVAKILVIKAGESLSLQFHRIKEETLYLESGQCHFEVGDSENALSTIHLHPEMHIHLPPGRIHRMTAITDCRLFEVSTPELDDVVRLKDKYGRQ